MNYTQALLMGVVEGITEYLPISSTFHLIWTAKLLGVSESEFLKAFEVIIQAGAIMAVLWLYIKEIITHPHLMKKLFISFIPTAVIGLILYKLIKGFFFESSPLQFVVLIGIGILFIVFDRLKGDLTLKNLSIKQAFIIGLFQALAVIPGVSRAGIVMLVMLHYGFSRKEAAKYSFMLALPTLSSAAAFDFVKLVPTLATHSPETGLLIAGTVMAFFSALLIVKWFIQYLQNHSLAVFGWYRIILGFVLLLATV